MFVAPSDTLVAYPGDSARFTCGDRSIRTIQSIEWLLNGSSLETLSLKNVTQVVARVGDEITSGLLRFSDLLLNYRMTTIQCRLVFEMGQSGLSMIALLVVQGDTQSSQPHT